MKYWTCFECVAITPVQSAKPILYFNTLQPNRMIQPPNGIILRKSRIPIIRRFYKKKKKNKKRCAYLCVERMNIKTTTTTTKAVIFIDFQLENCHNFIFIFPQYNRHQNFHIFSVTWIDYQKKKYEINNNNNKKPLTNSSFRFIHPS